MTTSASWRRASKRLSSTIVGSGIPTLSATILIASGKGNALDLHHEIENRAAFVTPKTVEDLLGGTDGKRGRLLLMKRTARHPVRALLLELHVVLHNPDDVCLSFEIVDECLGVTHLFKDD